MLWRPVALMRGPMRNKGRLLDVVAVAGLAGLAALCWYLHIVTPDGADPWLFRGGFLVTGIATLAVIAAVTHRGAHAGRLLGMPILLWIGIRSYGLYLYHWPIYQAMRGVAGNPLSIAQFVAALAISAVLAELSFRLIEMPIRKGHVGRWWRRLQAARDPAPRRIIAGAGAGMVALSVFAVATMATAELKPNEIAQSLNEAAGAVTDLDELGSSPATDGAGDRRGQRARPLPSRRGARPATRRSSCRRRRPPAPRPRRRPPEPPELLAIGDSVMLGAADELAAEGFVVSAEVSRQMKTMVPEMQRLRDAGQLGDTIVVHLGTNGPLGEQTVNDFFTAISSVPRVLVLTLSAPRDYIAGNNALLIGLPAQFPNVEILYWDGLAGQCPDNCFYEDGIHLRQTGQDYYTTLIAGQLGL